ncbi:TPA: tol-pal system protein YbgF [Photobacterium damselae]
MNSNNMRKLALGLLVGTATQLVAVPAFADSQLDRLERMLDARNQMMLDMQRQLDQISTDVDDLRGKVERNSYDLKQMLERQRELYREVDTLSSQQAQQAKETKATNTDAKENQESYSSNLDENQAYEQAVNLILKEKDYQGATKAFNDFIATYPKSVYAPNAHYWLGQLYFAQGQMKAADEHFTAVVAAKDSSKRADALLKLGAIAQKANDNAKATQYYQQVVKEFPSSTTATQAQAALNKLGQ